MFDGLIDSGDDSDLERDMQRNQLREQLQGHDQDSYVTLTDLSSRVGGLNLISDRMDGSGSRPTTPPDGLPQGRGGRVVAVSLQVQHASAGALSGEEGQQVVRVQLQVR